MRQQRRLGVVLIQDDNEFKTEICRMFSQAQKIISQSLRLTNENKEQLYTVISHSQTKYEGLQFIADKTVAPINKVEEEISLVELQIKQITQLKHILSDFLVNVQEALMYESMHQVQL
jgi:ribonuclease HII